MSGFIARIIFIIALPGTALVAGAWSMSLLCERKPVDRALAMLTEPKDRVHLNQRKFGYDRAEMNRHWQCFDDKAREAETCFLKLDLLLPVVYGVALLTSLLMVWNMLGKPFPRAWLVMPVALTMVADWCENLVQLGLLDGYENGLESSLNADWVQLASIATTLKLAFFVFSSVIILGMAAVVIYRSFKSS